MLYLIPFSVVYFFLTNPIRWAVTIAALFVATFRPKLRWPVLMIASIVMWFVRFSPEEFPLALPAGGILSVSATVAVAYFAAWTALILPWRIYIFLVYLISIFFMDYVRNQPLFALLLMFAQITGTLLWPITITSYLPAIRSRFSNWKTALLLVPFWQPFIALPVPGSPSLLLEHECKENLQLSKSQKSGLVLLLWIAALTVIANYFNLWAFGNARFALRGSFDEFLGFHGSGPFARLAAVIATTIRLILHFAVDIGVCIAVARFFGFDLPKMVDRPFLATDFNNFLGRIWPYYNQMLLKGIFPICRKLVPKTFPVKMRLTLALFLMISFGGYIFHFLRDFPLGITNSSLTEFTKSYLNVMPYYILLGLVASIAPLWRARATATAVLLRISKPALYLFIYAILFSFDLFALHDGKSWNEIWAIWKIF
jgi:hypothetical protein